MFGRSNDRLAAEADALLKKGIQVGLDGRPEEALRHFDELIRRFGDERVARVSLQVANAFYNKAMALYTSVLCSSGVVHAHGDYSFTIQRARIAKFSLYGAALDSCADVKQWPEIASGFGVPDRILALRADGDLLAYDAFYAGAAKWVRWDVLRARLSFVVIGGSEADVSAGVRGGIARTEVALA